MKLETKRLILRKPREEDWKEIYSLADDVAIRNFIMPYPYTKNHTKKLLSRNIEDWGKKSYWGIVMLKKTKEIVGVCGFRDMDKFNLTAEPITWIGPKFRKNNYALEIKIALNDYFFNNLKMRKLRSEVTTFNKASIKMQEKMGMTLEGIERKKYMVPALKKYADMNVYGLFKEDWKKISPKLKKELKVLADKLKEVKE